MEQKILVLGFQGYDFQNQDGSKQCGAKLLYLTRCSLNLDLKKGNLPLNSKCDLNYAKNLNSGRYPFVATAFMDTVPDSKGNPSIVIADLHDIKDVSFDSFFK